MKLVQFLIFFVFIYLVDCRNHVKSLTESMGQEVIEIGTPIKELPPGLEEEPSVENDEDPTSKPPPQPATKRETKRVTTTTTATTKAKEDDKEDSISQEDEEARIEKELAEIYKDTDYKSDSHEVKTLNASLNTEKDKPVLRAKTNFKFQPDVNNRQEVERFRTSVDEISCERRVTQKLNAETNGNTERKLMSFIQIGLVIISLVVCY